MATAVGVVLTGVVKPYVRMTRRGKWQTYVRKNGKLVANPAQQYIASQEALKHQIKEQLKNKGHKTETFPIFKNKQPLRAMLTIVVANDLHRKDLDNQIKAVLDAAQGLIFENDLWIDSISAERSLGSENLTELVLISHDHA